jgi:hypothetical protein
VVVALLLLSGAGAVASWASITATDTNSGNTWTVASAYIQDSAGVNTNSTYTGGQAIANSAPNIASTSVTALTYYIAVEFQNSDTNSATMTLTPTYSAGTGSPTEADMSLQVQAGTGCTNLTGAHINTLADASPSTTCTGGFTAFGTGGTPIGPETFTAASGTPVAVDGSSGSATWVAGTSVVTFAITVTPNGSQTAGQYQMSFEWIATSS